MIGAIFENCDKKSRQPILKLPTSFEAIGTVHQLVCDGVKRPAWRTISANQPNHNRKIQHKCNAQQHQFTPLSNLEKYPELNRRITDEEYETLVDYAIDIGIENGFIQEGDTAEESFIPAFDCEGV